MMRSRSSGLLPITTSASFHRYDSLGLIKRSRRSGGGAPVLRLLTYLGLTALLGGSIYAVTRVGSLRNGMSGSAFDGVLSDELLDSARFGGSGGTLDAGLDGAHGHGHGHGLEHHHSMEQLEQQQQQQPVHGLHDLHDSLQQHGLHAEHADRRSAMEQLQAEAAAVLEQQRYQQQQEQQALQQQGLEAQQVLEQQALEAAHLEELQQMEEQQVGLHHLQDPVLAAAIAAHIAEQQSMPARSGPSLYTANLSAVDIRGNVMHTADLTGKVTIVVNVASKCGYTESNYQGLQRLYNRYSSYGLEVVAFPCNQFGQQEPGSHGEIEAFATQRYGVTFPLMSKVEVNGEQQHPIYAWLKANTPAEPGKQQGADILWNFEKFLLDKHGHPVKRYSSELVYHDIELDVYNELIKY